MQRHTWQSWRERYKKNADRLDIIISNIVSERQVTKGGRGQYGWVRKSEDKPKRKPRPRKANVSAAKDEAVEAESGGQAISQSSLHPPEENGFIYEPVAPHLSVQASPLRVFPDITTSESRSFPQFLSSPTHIGPIDPILSAASVGYEMNESSEIGHDGLPLSPVKRWPIEGADTDVDAKRLRLE